MERNVEDPSPSLLPLPRFVSLAERSHRHREDWPPVRSLANVRTLRRARWGPETLALETLTRNHRIPVVDDSPAIAATLESILVPRVGRDRLRFGQRIPA